MKAIRGSALPETAVVITVALMVIFGVTQLALLGWAQASTDGAAEIAAHVSAFTGLPAQGPLWGNRVFPNVPAGSIAVGFPASGGRSATAEVNTGGLLLLSGAPSSYTVSGGAVESSNTCFACWTLPNPNVAYKYGALPTTLPSYVSCNVTNLSGSGNTPPGCTANSAYNIFLAQAEDWNPDALCPQAIAPCFKQWACHLATYENLYDTGQSQAELPPPSAVCAYGFDQTTNVFPWAGGAGNCTGTKASDAYGTANEPFDPLNLANDVPNYEAAIYSADGGGLSTGDNQC